MQHSWRAGIIVLAITLAVATGATPIYAASSFIGFFHAITTIRSTVPANGDVNPYGIAVVPRSIGRLSRGAVLVSNFNNGHNLQGTGTTIVEIAPNGTRQQFAQIRAGHLPGACPGGVGLTTALAVLRSGWVIVGSLPTADGSAATAKAGCLIVLNHNGDVVETFSGNGINGPWDMAALDRGDSAVLFVTNVLNGTVANSPHVVHRGTVLRIVLHIPNYGLPQRVATTTIGSGFAERTDPGALVIGPTGVALGANGTLYVADSLNNRIAAIPNALFRWGSAGVGVTIARNGWLNDPLGLAIAPNDDILTVNGNDGRLVETRPNGSQIRATFLDSSGSPPGAGALFGLAIRPGGVGLYYVDDADNTLKVLH
jgi:hypothetical protein